MAPFCTVYHGRGSRRRRGRPRGVENSRLETGGAAGSPGAGGVLGQKRAGGLSRRLTERTPGEPGGAAERRGPDLTDTRRGEDSERADGRVRGSAMITSAGECRRERRPTEGAAAAPAFS
jgi:hypothetical protein